MRRFYFLLLFLFPGFLFAQNTITCDSILQTSTCAGGNVIVSFNVTGTFPWGNVFTAELSDNWGQWNSPVAIGTTLFTIGGNGIIFATIPTNANFGFLYRIRVISSSPSDTSNNSPNTLIVTQIAQLNQIVSNPGDSACPGDTITLYALNPANSYQWSTGDTTASIQVTQSGAYSVTTTDALTCQSTAHDTIVFDAALCTGIAEQADALSFGIYPNPATNNAVLEYSNAGDDSWYDIFDATGQLVEHIRISESTTTIDLNGWTSGIYLVTLHNGSVSSSRKLIVE